MVKISALSALNDPQEGDLLPVVDLDGNITKRLRVGDIPKGFTAGSIDADALAANVMNRIYPVGSIYTNAIDGTNPATLLGFGTWVPYASGRVLVGHDANDTDFNTAGKLSGSKTHTLSVGQLPAHSHTGSTNTTGSHTHGINAAGNHSHGVNLFGDSMVRTAGGGTNNRVAVGGSGQQLQWGGLGINAAGNHSHSMNGAGNHSHSFTTNNTGSGQAISNLQPGIAVYIWRRTA